MYLEFVFIATIILLTNTTAMQNEVALSYDKVRGLYFMAVVFAATIYYIEHDEKRKSEVSGSLQLQFRNLHQQVFLIIITYRTTN